MKLMCIFKNSVHIKKQIPLFFTTISWFLLFKKMTIVYYKNNNKPISTLCGLNRIIKS